MIPRKLAKVGNQSWPLVEQQKLHAWAVRHLKQLRGIVKGPGSRTQKQAQIISLVNKEIHAGRRLLKI